MARILWLSHFMPFPPRGGSFQRSYNLLKRLSRIHDVRYVGLHDPDRNDEESVKRARTDLGEHCTHFETFPNERLRRAPRLFYGLISMFRGLPIGVGALNSRRFLDAARNAVRDVDIVHCDTFELAYLVSRMKLPPSVRVVSHFHNVESLLAERAAQRTPYPVRFAWKIEAPLLARLERRVLALVDLSVTVSDLDGVSLREAGAARVLTIENGVDLEYFGYLPPAERGGASTITWIGGLTWFPNRDAVEYFLEQVWPIIQARVLDAAVVVVGRGSTRPFRPGCLDPSVSLTGFVEDARPYFHRAGVFIVPLRIGGGSRLKILDAFATGTPVVATRIGAEGLEVEDGKHLLLADDPEEFAHATIKILGDSELRSRLAAAGRRLVEERYGWDALGARLAAAYSELASSGSSQAIPPNPRETESHR